MEKLNQGQELNQEEATVIASKGKDWIKDRIRHTAPGGSTAWDRALIEARSKEELIDIIKAKMEWEAVKP